MSTYYMNEAAFDVPAVGFVDRSVTCLEAPVGSGDEQITLMVERAPAEDRPLATIVGEHVYDAKKRLLGYAVIHQTERVVEDLPAVDLAARFTDEDGLAYSRSVHLIVNGTWMIVGSEGPLEHRGLCDECLEHVLSTLQLRA